MKLAMDDLRVGDVIQHVTSNGYRYEPLLLLERAVGSFRWLSLYDGTVHWQDYSPSGLDTPLNFRCKRLAYGMIELLAEGA